MEGGNECDVSVQAHKSVGGEIKSCVGSVCSGLYKLTFSCNYTSLYPVRHQANAKHISVMFTWEWSPPIHRPPPEVSSSQGTRKAEERIFGTSPLNRPRGRVLKHLGCGGGCVQLHRLLQENTNGANRRCAGRERCPREKYNCSSQTGLDWKYRML